LPDNPFQASLSFKSEARGYPNRAISRIGFWTCLLILDLAGKAWQGKMLQLILPEWQRNRYYANVIEHLSSSLTMN
jgi:hypothetical protein